MDHTDQWWQSPSGSRADETWNSWITSETSTEAFPEQHDDPTNNVDSLMDLEEDEAVFATQTFGASDLRPGELMSSKVPPAFNGKSSWFAYEELIYDWQDITVLDAEKQGPALKARLTEDAAIYKSYLDREKLRSKDTGVEYFIKTLRPYFVKSATHVFLYRLMQFLNQRRAKLDIHRWIAKFELQKKRLFDAWMDLSTDITDEHHESYDRWYIKIQKEQRAKTPPEEMLEDEDLFTRMNELRVEHHKKQFPFSDHLLTLIFIIFSQLQDQQRLLLTQHMSIKNIKLESYDFKEIRSWFLEILVTARSSIENPTVRENRGFTQRPRTFYVEDEGEMDGVLGVWAEDEETGIEGFLEGMDDVFWTYDETSHTWAMRRFRGRRIIRGRRRKGKGKGRKGRRKGFRRRTRKGKGKGKGRSWIVEDDQYEDEYIEGYEPYPSSTNWTNDNEWWTAWIANDGYWHTAQAWQTWLQEGNEVVDSADAVKGKGKGKKGKSPFNSKGFPGKGKGTSKGKGKGDKSSGEANATQPQSVQPPSYSGNTQQDPYPPMTPQDQQWYQQDLWNEGVWPTNVATGWSGVVLSTQLPQLCFSTMEEEKQDFSYQGYDWTTYELHMANLVDIRKNPLCVILDLGCTRSMGSKAAVMAFIEAGKQVGLTFEWKRCWTKMAFANSQTETLEWCVIVTFPTQPPIRTTIDVHENGTIPILLSLPQMMKLGLVISCSENEVTLTCDTLGFKNKVLPFSSSRHVILDLSDIKGKLRRTNDTSLIQNKVFLSSDESRSMTTDIEILPVVNEDEILDDQQESSFPTGTRIRLDTKTPVNRERNDLPVPVHKRPVPRNKGKVKRTGKPQGEPDEIISPKVLDRPESLIESPGNETEDVNSSSQSNVKDVNSSNKQSGHKTGPKGTRSPLSKIYEKLRDKTELYKLHLKHYHMTPANFRKRTSELSIPKDIYELYETVVKECRSCQKFAPAPERSKVTGMRATNFGDLWFVDHVDITVDEYMYCVLVIVDAATNFIWATAQKGKMNNTTIAHMEQAFRELHARPRSICGDSYFHEQDFQKFYGHYGIRPIALGPNTPWPNRAEAAVKLIKHQTNILIDSLRRYETEIPSMRNVSVNAVIGFSCWARNVSITYGGKTPAEMAFGRRPPDILTIENMTSHQLSTEEGGQQKLNNIIQQEALKAHLEARQRVDLRRDLVARLKPSDGPFEPGQSVWYWSRDMSKLRGGEWLPARVTTYTKPPMVTIEQNGNSIQVNQSKLRKNPDNWHDVVIPGLSGRDGTVTVPGTKPETFDPRKQQVLRRIAKKTILEHVKRKDKLVDSSDNQGEEELEKEVEKAIEESIKEMQLQQDDEDPMLQYEIMNQLQGGNKTPPAESSSKQRVPSPDDYDPLDALPQDDLQDLENELFGDEEVDFCQEQYAPQSWIITDGPTSFRQFCSTSDKMSAFFSTLKDTTVGDPVLISEAPIEYCMYVNQNNPSTLIWISPPDDDPYYADLSYHLITQQIENNKYFVLAINTLSSLWHSNALRYLYQQIPTLSYTTVNLEMYDENKKDFDTLCLMHNFSSNDLSPLIRKTKEKLTRQHIPTDDYPISFCESVYSLVTDAIRSHSGLDDQLPCSPAIGSKVLEDIFEDLDNEELSYLVSQTKIDDSYSCNNHVSDLSSAMSLSSFVVVNKEFKEFMNWLNSRPKQTNIDFGVLQIQQKFSKHVTTLKKMREYFFPESWFDHCHVFRGTTSEQLMKIQGNDNPAAIIMWKKNDSRKRLIAAKIESCKFDKFDPSQWSIIIFSNLDGTLTRQERSRGTEGQRTSPRTSSEAPPRERPVPSTPVEQPYADPDLPIPPMSNNSQRSRSTRREGHRPSNQHEGQAPFPPPSEGKQSTDLDIDPDDFINIDPNQDDDYHSTRSRSRDGSPPRGRSRHRDRSQSRDRPVEPERGRPRESSRSRDRAPRNRESSRSRDRVPHHRDASRSRDREQSSRRREDRSHSRDDDQRPRSDASRSRDGSIRDDIQVDDHSENSGSTRSRSTHHHRTMPVDSGRSSSSQQPMPMAPPAVASRPVATKSSDQSLLPPQLKSQPIPKPKGTAVKSEHYSSHWISAQRQDDLVVLEDDDSWSLHTMLHKLAANAASFTFVRDADEQVVDISVIETLPSVNRSLYLTNAWHQDASVDEVMIDIEHLPEAERHSLLAALPNQQSGTVPEARARRAPRRKVNAARREATAQEKRMYAKQFLEAKKDEWKSWSKDNDVLELVDMRKIEIKNYITGRWVLTVKRDKEGKFSKCKARWVLRGFQDAQHWDLQTDSPTSTRPGFRLQCQAAAINKHNIGHIDLKTAFLQGESFDGTRNVICQIPPEAGLPSHMGARLKRAAYGLNDAPRLWWNRLDKRLRSYGLVPTRADRCCYVLYTTTSSTRSDTYGTNSLQPDPAIWEANSTRTVPKTHFYCVCSQDGVTSCNRCGEPVCRDCYFECRGCGAVVHRNHNVRVCCCYCDLDNKTWLYDPSSAHISSTRDSSKSQELDIDGALELLLDPITGSNSKNKIVDGIITIYVDDAFFAGNDRFHKTVIDNLRKDFQVGHEDLNDVMFVGQRVRWINKNEPSKAHIMVDQMKKVEELTEVVFDTKLQDHIVCTKDLHTQFRSVLGQINWLQARTQYQSCYSFSRCASAAASPTIGDVRAINKLVRKIRSEDVVLRFWPLNSKNLRIVGYPDAAYKNNKPDNSSQRGQVVFLAEARVSGKKDARGSLIDYESQKIRRTVLSTTVSELYAFMKCFGTCQFLRGLWMDIFGAPAELNMRTDANNLVTTAKTTHLPEQKETIHMINQLRHEACSGAIQDLAHVISEDCLSDCLTKANAKPDALIKAVTTGYLPNVDKHPPFRELMKNKHKAYTCYECTDELVSWLVHNLNHVTDVSTFLTFPVSAMIEQHLSSTNSVLLMD